VDVDGLEGRPYELPKPGIVVDEQETQVSSLLRSENVVIDPARAIL
jgi:hypothetical protein